jgi:hypothetical protein
VQREVWGIERQVLEERLFLRSSFREEVEGVVAERIGAVERILRVRSFLSVCW